MVFLIWQQRCKLQCWAYMVQLIQHSQALLQKNLLQLPMISNVDLAMGMVIFKVVVILYVCLVSRLIKFGLL
ncbi:hypothetical protein F753_09020 [Stutzerimonas chloritidismutans AW-1]|uniref:Uncharacterized protein n=1 Tax=Stutzerimonas chloritidismutans AW-1 TaxID=1263865 RepID=V4QIN8_STUCH|nr:hypothetical protein F753_09020 [Stutzerimonas chloritidismutans AW-1]